MRTIAGLLELDETMMLADLAPEAHQNTSSLKVFGLPFLESHIHRLDLYSNETQLMLVEIRTGLQAFNQQAEEATHYQFLMFGSGLGRGNLETLRRNIETCYERAAEKASDLIARIAVVVHSAEMKAR